MEAKHVIKVRVTLTEEALGMASNNPDIHNEYIASKAPDARKREEEVASVGVEGVIDKSTTVFPRDAEGFPIAYDYQWKGFFKDAAGALRRVSGTKCSKIKAYKKEIDGLLFVMPRQIRLDLSGDMGDCQRPLRASTPQGERVALAHSETVPAGTTMDFEIHCLNDDMRDLTLECMDYGKLRGFGQWRNSGKGRFDWQILEQD